MKYSCLNCHNLKTKVVTRAEIAKISKYRIAKALKERDPDSLDLMFPFNATVYNRIIKDGRCPILYCSERMFNRDLYIYRENLDIASVYPFKNKPCQKYR